MLTGTSDNLDSLDHDREDGTLAAVAVDSHHKDLGSRAGHVQSPPP